MDTVFAIFIMTLVAIFIAINIYADLSDKYDKYMRRTSKANERASRNCIRPVPVVKYEKQKNRTTKRELNKLYEN